MKKLKEVIMKRFLLTLVCIFFLFETAFAGLLKFQGKVINVDRKRGSIVIDTGSEKLGFTVKKEMLERIVEGTVVIVIYDEDKDVVVSIEKVPPPGPY